MDALNQDLTPPNWNDQPSPARGNLAGRFVVECKGIRHMGIAAHVALETLQSSPSLEHKLFLINRQWPSGEFELIGVEPAALTRMSAMLYWFEDVQLGRAAYETLTIQGAAIGTRVGSGSPPPCRLEVQFARVPGKTPPVVLAIRFPEPCFNAVVNWIRSVIQPSAVRDDAGRKALLALDDAAPQVMESATIEPAP